MRRWGRSRWASSPSCWPPARRKRCCRGADAALLHTRVAATPSTRSFSRRVLAGDDVGTYFSNDIARKPSLDEGNPLEAVGQSARRAARALQALEAGDRTKILQAIASKLRAAAPAILAANAPTWPTRAAGRASCASVWGCPRKSSRPWRKAWKHWPTRRTPFSFGVPFCFICGRLTSRAGHRMAYGWHPTPSTRRFSERYSPLYETQVGQLLEKGSSCRDSSSKSGPLHSCGPLGHLRSETGGVTPDRRAGLKGRLCRSYEGRLRS